MVNEIPYVNSAFEQPWWLDIVAPGKWDEVTIKEHDQVIARLPYVISDGKISMPLYTQTLGIWIDSKFKEFRKGNDHLAEQKKIIHQLLSLLPKSKSVDFVFDSAVEYILPFRWEGYSIDPTFSYRITELDKEIVDNKLGKGIKRDLNRGMRLFSIDENNNSIDEFIALQNLTYSRQNRKNPVNNDLTASIISKAIDAQHGKLLFARDDDGKAHAACFLLYDKNVCYHLLSGQNTIYGNDGAMPFLLYNEILFASKNSRIFDFEGSMVEGIEQVYRRYGGKQVINWHVSKQSVLHDIFGVMKPRIKRLIGYKI